MKVDNYAAKLFTNVIKNLYKLHFTYFLIYDTSSQRHLENEVDCCSLDYCWLLTTEQQWNPVYRR